MKVDNAGFHVGLGILASVDFILFIKARKRLKLFSIILFGFLCLEIILQYIPSKVAWSLWWFIHIPSAVILGDEIFERFGIIISTAAHLLDLVLWSAMIMIPMLVNYYIECRSDNSVKLYK
jgi:hypothetical protein